MKHRWIALLLALPVVGAGPTGYKYWSATELKGYEKKLAPKITAVNKLAIEDRMIDYGNYWAGMVHREGTMPAELHETSADVMVISSGTATLVVGGTIPGGKTTGPGEIRGLAIEGG